ncbi:MAG: DUF4279 domain-containing protein [Clostridia bacterium]|nr:DUF4279 domain-containing protein [Clostridia bacterium]
MDKIGEIIVSLSGENINFEAVSRQLKSKPSKMVKKGTNITPKMVAPNDRWLSITEIVSIDEMDNKLLNILTQLISVSTSLENLKSEGIIVSCDVYLRPRNEQFGYSLSIDAIRILSKLNLEINYHIITS